MKVLILTLMLAAAPVAWAQPPAPTPATGSTLLLQGDIEQPKSAGQRLQGSTSFRVYDNPQCEGRPLQTATLSLARPGDWKKLTFAPQSGRLYVQSYTNAFMDLRTSSRQTICLAMTTYEPEGGHDYRLNHHAETYGACAASMSDDQTGGAPASMKQPRPEGRCQNW